MKHWFANFCQISAVLTACFGATMVSASQAPNPRASSATSSVRTDVRDSKRSTTSATAAGARSATARRNARVTNRSATNQNVSNARSAARQVVANPNRGMGTSGIITIRSASPAIVRSATMTGANVARSGTNIANAGVGRMATARATAVFSDVSKIGGGYAKCRDSYATCMDQFCANANDTYRRCFCSSRFEEFRDTEAALDEAKTLLQRFEDTNLAAVDLTASEVDAMYSATIGEMAIKSDVSGAQAALNEIGALLSGEKKAGSSSNAQNDLLAGGFGGLDFAVDMNDIWSNSGSSSIFDSGADLDLSALEGTKLYNSAHEQCEKLSREACGDNVVFNMAKSAYNIMITQDCNAYEKKINSQREAVKSTVRQAEKYLREARLENYRAHNSADINECIDKVKTAITTDAACGDNYNRCLDYSGAYINQANGEPIYSPRLFELADVITLDGADGDGDVLGQNPRFNQFLDEKRKFAETALDTCRDQADIVWQEFKRSALIEIAQAQDNKIEQVKNSCVSTMADCYDTQTNALKEFDNTTAQSSGAISAYAARSMCEDKVIACASLYGNTDGCEFDGNGKITAGNDNRTSDISAGVRCGLTALLSFVDSVDEMRIAEGCDEAIDNYLQEICTPSVQGQVYPWNCRKLAFDGGAGSLTDMVQQYAGLNCLDPSATDRSYNALPDQTKLKVERALQTVREQMDYVLSSACEELDGYWLDSSDGGDDDVDLMSFYHNVYGSTSSTSADIPGAKTWGRCVQNTTRMTCLAFNDLEYASDTVASYDLTRDECTFSDTWYETQCQMLGNGYMVNGICYSKPYEASEDKTED